VFGGAHNEALVVGSRAPRDKWFVMAALQPGSGQSARRFEAGNIPVRWLALTRLRRTASPLFWSAFPFRFVADVCRLVRLIRRERIDLVEGASVNLQSAVAARLAGTACVWRLVDISAPSPVRRLVALVVPYLADEILVNGRATMEAYPGLRRSRVPVGVYYPMIDEGAFGPRTLEQEHADAAVVGTVANINPDKGIDVFVEAAGMLAERTDVRFVVVGAEHETHRAYAIRARARATEIGIGQRLAFVGEQTDVAEWLRRMDVFVISSRREGTTTTAIEAMASGLPIVATDVGAIHEVIEDGRTGLLATSDDPAALARCIGELLDSPVRRASLGSAARRAYERRFSTARLLASRLGVYSRVLARRAR
jgi:glycosyltransferase involved in cell wall biosynthesis